MRSFVFCLLALSVLTVNAQNINVRGVVTDTKSGKTLPNATVTLLHQLLKDTTAVTTGAYAITKGTISVMPDIKIQNGSKISLKSGLLELNLTSQAQVKIETFNVKGDLLKKELLPAASAGIHNFNIADNNRATNILIVKVAIGDQTTTFRYLPEHNNNFAINAFVDNSMASSSRLAKTAAAISDTLHLTANGYLTKMIPISSYDTIVNITLDSLYQGPSIGCGKSLGSLKTGTYSITSAGLNREYIIDIPANYNPNKPYRLIFGMHCMCGSMWSVQSENFYELKRCADSANEPCIFVAPSVYNGGNYNQSTWGCPVWDQGAKDHTFFDDMVTLFKGELCVDTNRIFSAGFSYGSMFTNALAQNHQKVLRAVVCYETSFGGGIYVPNNIGLPIAWMGVVGMSDTRCPPSDGRTCRDTILKYNKCIKPATVPETFVGSKTHLIYDYIGGIRPVKWCTADCDHQWSEYDGGAIGSYDPNKTWTAEVAWHFFAQF